MSLRDWFAGMALQGYLSGRNSPGTDPSKYQVDNAAEQCFHYADAMIAARAGKEAAQ